MKLRTLTATLLCLAVYPACGPGGIPGAGGSRESGQSKLMDQTFAGKNACNPDNAERPFIIEWDATDMSSFESFAADDVVLVKYEGCNLKVLDHCRNDSVKGSLGTYRPVEWTSGSLEKMEISNEAELYANLPLGAASLGGRVSGGEKFRMEYYVAGTRTATRDAVYADDLKKIPGCEGATHFVYGYNLGAFALGSVTNTSAEAGGSLYGFGAGGSKKTTQKADKQGGDLGTCKSDSAKEIEGCKVPIRLTLRRINSGENPEVASTKAPETDASLNAAGRIEAKLDPKHKSTDPKSGFGLPRGQCLMMAGKCDAGKQLVRKTLEANGQVASTGPEHIDKMVEAYASMHCQGAMSSRDQLLKSLQELQQGAFMTKKTVPFCENAYKTAKRLLKTVKPKDDDDSQIANAPKSLFTMAGNCAARAGDCKAAYKLFSDAYPPESLEKVKDAKQRETIIRSTFDSIVSKCKGK
jgi:hypothetical protein